MFIPSCKSLITLFLCIQVGRVKFVLICARLERFVNVYDYTVIFFVQYM